VTFLAFLVVWQLPGAEECLKGALDPGKQEELGLDRPLLVRYGLWWVSVFQGRFGYSCRYPGQWVTQKLFLGAWEWSLALSGLALLLTWLIGLPLGIFLATHPGSLRGLGIQILGLIGLAIPPFLLALLFLLLLLEVGAARWGWALGQVMADEYFGAPWSWGKLGNVLLHLGPPLLAIVLIQWTGLTRHLQSALRDALGQPYIQAVRAKGVGEPLVVYKHALRNALPPLIGWMGFWLPTLFEGTLAVSIVLNYPTVEFYFWDAVRRSDPYVILGGLFFLGAIVTVGNLLADLLLAVVDPRIRYD